MDTEHRFDDASDLVRNLDLDGLVDADLPPPNAPTEGGGGPASDGDTWLARSPFWAIPLVISVIFGIERVAMLAVVPGWRELPILVFGSLFILTFAVVLALGGLAIARHRR